MSTAGAIDPAELAAFVEQFVVAVDFQNPVSVAGDTKLADLPEWETDGALGASQKRSPRLAAVIRGDRCPMTPRP